MPDKKVRPLIRTVQRLVRLTDEEDAMYREAAICAGLDVSSWMRDEGTIEGCGTQRT